MNRRAQIFAIRLLVGLACWYVARHFGWEPALFVAVLSGFSYYAGLIDRP